MRGLLSPCPGRLAWGNLGRRGRREVSALPRQPARQPSGLPDPARQRKTGPVSHLSRRCEEKTASPPAPERPPPIRRHFWAFRVPEVSSAYQTGSIDSLSAPSPRFAQLAKPATDRLRTEMATRCDGTLPLTYSKPRRSRAAELSLLRRVRAGFEEFRGQRATGALSRPDISVGDPPSMAIPE
jgi:hypothetical protein